MNIQQIAMQAEQIKQQYEAGQMTAEEYKELINDIGALEAIHNDAVNLEDNIMYRDMLITAINIAKALA